MVIATNRCGNEVELFTQSLKVCSRRIFRKDFDDYILRYVYGLHSISSNIRVSLVTVATDSVHLSFVE